jgi:hypothetical protein
MVDQYASVNSGVRIQDSGVLECWSIGVLEYWSTGVLEYWSIGVLEYWSVGVTGVADESPFVLQLLNPES